MNLKFQEVYQDGEVKFRKSFGQNKCLVLILRLNQDKSLNLIGKKNYLENQRFHSILRFLEYSGRILLRGRELFLKMPYRERWLFTEERSWCLSWLSMSGTLLANLKVYQVRCERKIASSGWNDCKLKKENYLIKSRLVKKSAESAADYYTFTRADLIILDEPFSGLDPVNTEIFKASYYWKKERGATVYFLIMSDKSAERYNVRSIMLRDGKKPFWMVVYKFVITMENMTLCI